MKDFELSICPVETYNAPEIPVFGSDNSAILKKLPSRWQKNAKILACIGIVGTLTLSGCSFVLRPSPPLQIVLPLTQDRLDIMHNLAQWPNICSASIYRKGNQRGSRVE